VQRPNRVKDMLCEMRATIWVLVCVVACGSPEPAYPRAACGGGGDPTFCQGREVKLATLVRGGDDTFDFVELGRNAPGTAAPYVHHVQCAGCPFREGEIYRARLTKPNATGHEQIYGILYEGSEITWTPHAQQTYALMPLQIYACDQPGAQHWEKLDGKAECKAGASGTPKFTAARTHVSPGCLDAWPTGIVKQVAGRDPIKVNIKIQSTYTFKNAEMTHQLAPQTFVDALNRLGPPHDHQFVLADGLPMLYATITFTSDSTGDHYGMNVSVEGPGDPNTFRHGGDETELFTYSVPPLYTTAEGLFGAGAVPMFERVYLPGGWTCDESGAHSRETLEHMCAANPTQQCGLPKK
jgi:hypothetical protein